MVQRMIVLMPGELVKATVGDSVFWLSPLDVDQLQKVLQFSKNQAGERIVDRRKTAMTVLKYGLKGTEGLTLSDGSDLKLKFDKNGHLCEEHCEALIRSSIIVETLALKMAEGHVPSASPGVQISSGVLSGAKKKPRRASVKFSNKR